jgi:multidrug efflux pump subunit AcrA (membrane-fusion protein)
MLQTQDGKATRREVKTGWKEGSSLEITTGLKEGDVVLIGGGSGKK